MPTWPATLPQDPLVGIGLNEIGNSVIRVEMEGGPAQQRRRYSGSTFNVNANFIMTDQQVLIFRDFYENTLKKVGRFDFVDPNGGSAREFRFVASSPPRIDNMEGGEDGDPNTLPGTSLTTQSIWQVTCALEMFT